MISDYAVLYGYFGTVNPNIYVSVTIPIEGTVHKHDIVCAVYSIGAIAATAICKMKILYYVMMAS